MSRPRQLPQTPWQARRRCLLPPFARGLAPYLAGYTLATALLQPGAWGPWWTMGVPVSLLCFKLRPASEWPV